MNNFKRKGCKKLGIIALLFTFIISMTSCSNGNGESSKSEKANDNKKIVSTKVEDGKVYASLKEAFEFIDGKCTIDRKNATAKKDKDTVKVSASSKEAELNSKKIALTDESKSINNDIYFPINFLNEVMDARVSMIQRKRF